MPIFVTPDNIPKVWDVIKYASSSVQQVSEELREEFFNNLLYRLLSGKNQCFITKDNDKIKSILITEVIVDRIKQEKMLNIVTLYSFKYSTNDFWNEEFKFIESFARSKGCKYITCFTNNKRIEEICYYLGFNLRMKSFMKEI